MWYGFDFNPTVDRIRVVSDARAEHAPAPRHGHGRRRRHQSLAAGRDRRRRGLLQPVRRGDHDDAVRDQPGEQQPGHDRRHQRHAQPQRRGRHRRGSAGGERHRGARPPSTSRPTTRPSPSCAPSGGASTLYTINLATGATTPAGTVGDGSTTFDDIAVVDAPGFDALTAERHLHQPPEFRHRPARRPAGTERGQRHGALQRPRRHRGDRVVHPAGCRGGQHRVAPAARTSAVWSPDRAPTPSPSGCSSTTAAWCSAR